MSPHQQRIVSGRTRDRTNTSSTLRLARFRRQSSRPAVAAAVRCTVRSISDADIAPAIGIDVERSCPPFADFSIDHNLTDPDKARQLKPGVKQNRLKDRPKPASPGFPPYPCG